MERIGFGGKKRFDWIIGKRRLNKMEGTWLIGDVLKDLTLTSYGEIFNRQDHALQGL